MVYFDKWNRFKTIKLVQLCSISKFFIASYFFITKSYILHSYSLLFSWLQCLLPLFFYFRSSRDSDCLHYYGISFGIYYTTWHMLCKQHQKSEILNWTFEITLTINVFVGMRNISKLYSVKKNFDRIIQL